MKDLAEAVDHYSKLFDATVNEREPGSANFAIDEQSPKLVLFENPDADERLDDRGIEVFDDVDVYVANVQCLPRAPKRIEPARDELARCLECVREPLDGLSRSASEAPRAADAQQPERQQRCRRGLGNRRGAGAAEPAAREDVAAG